MVRNETLLCVCFTNLHTKHNPADELLILCMHAPACPHLPTLKKKETQKDTKRMEGKKFSSIIKIRKTVLYGYVGLTLKGKTGSKLIHDQATLGRISAFRD